MLAYAFDDTLAWAAGGGFIAGLLAYAIARALVGVDRRRQAQMNAANDRAHELEGAVSSLKTELAQAVPIAALASSLEREVLRLRAVEGKRHSQLDEKSKQLARAEEELETLGSSAHYFQDELGRLSARHEEECKIAYAHMSEMNGVISNLNERMSVETASHEVELSRLKAEVAMAAQGIDRDLHEVEVATLLSTINDLRAELSVSPA